MSALHSNVVAPLLFEFVDRGEIDMPADYLPEAPGVLVTSETPNAAKLDGWRRHHPGDYRKRVGKHVFQVRQCGDSKSNHWTIERFEFFDYNGTEALVFPFGRFADSNAVHGVPSGPPDERPHGRSCVAHLCLGCNR